MCSRKKKEICLAKVRGIVRSEIRAWEALQRFFPGRGGFCPVFPKGYLWVSGGKDSKEIGRTLGSKGPINKYYSSPR